MLKINRALFSLTDKDNSVILAKVLLKHNANIIASSGTCRFLRDNKIDAVDISTLTGFSQLLEGRVKTLDPKIFAPILARKEKPDDLKEIYSLGLQPVDLVVCNLYPFEMVSQNPFCSHNDLLENIDIGGVTLIRAAAKNYHNCAILTSPAQYGSFITELDDRGYISAEMLLELALEAFRKIAVYDSVILRELSQWKVQNNNVERVQDKFPRYYSIHLNKDKDLTYGENPHQEAALYNCYEQSLNSEYSFQKLNGKDLSFNNIMDISACLEILSEFDGQTACACSIIKHTNPCGVSISDNPLCAFKRAYSTDTMSPFGGIAGFNTEVDEDTAKELSKSFFEVIIAKQYSEPAILILKKKKKLRVIRYKSNNIPKGEILNIKKTSIGFLAQDSDWVKAGFPMKVVTKRQPTSDEKYAMILAWKVAKHTKSNAVVIADKEGTIGIGAGQMNRVGALKIALSNRELEIQGAVLASDGFFPFRDSIDLAVQAGIKAIIQPGGSIRDADVIKAADEGNISMVFTSFRNFNH